MDKLLGELILVKIYKYLKEGLSDKTDEEFSHFRQVNSNKTEVECDCCVCFSGINRETNPIVYCSGKKYSPLTQLYGCFPPGLLPNTPAA